MKKIKIGIVGTGGIAEEHIKSYMKNPNVELYAFCDINKTRLDEMGKKYEITRLFTDKKDLLALSEIDAVSICTWNSEHAECTIAALEAGKHVLCEKPMSINQAEAIKMKETADKTDKLLMIGFVRRFGNDCSILKDFVAKDYFGDFYYAKATYLRRNGNPGGWFGDTSRSGGGSLIDLGVHVIDFVRYVMGNPKPVSVYGVTYQKLFNRRNIKTPKAYISRSVTNNDICDVEDLASALIRFDNGATLSVETSFSLNIKKPEGKIEFFGTKGGACLNPELEIYTEIYDYLADVTLDAKTALSFDGLFENEINHFISCVKGETKCISTAKDGIEIMEILDAIYESARLGHEVITK